MESKPSANWYVRASSMGALMSKGQKGELFGATAREVISDAIRFNRDGTEKDLSGVKYLRKGIQNESQALELFLNNKGVKFEKDDSGFVITNKLRRFNDYVTGEPDWCDENILADVKCSWSASSFPDVLKKPSDDLKKINKDYWFQMQCYMWLCDRETSFLAYCLTDTSDDLFEKEVYFRTLDKNGQHESHDKSMSEVEDEVRQRLEKSHRFSQVKNRIRVFQVDRDEEAIEEMKKRVEEAREKYDEFYHKV